MSMIVCESCAAYIDSDDDPNCFVYVGNYRRLHAEIVLCERGRETREDELDAQNDAADRCIAEMEKETST